MVLVHDTLNPKLWDKFKLKPDIRDRILEIVDEFKSMLDFELNMLDIRIVGSQASYNYTESSDLDIHIVTNFELMDASEEILSILYNYVKTQFNKDYDISIKGIKVELYIEDMKSTAISNGIYSVKNNSWVKLPKKIENVPDIDISDDYEEWVKGIKNALNNPSKEEIQSIIDEIYIIRKNSLDQEGEFGSGNQLFKAIRSDGWLDKLKDAYKDQLSKDLTLEHLRLTEASRSNLLAKSKQSKKGFERFKKRVKSRVANSVKQYNAIDMNKLFKDNILTVDINVKGETDEYIVKISFGGFAELIRDQINRTGRFDLRAVTRALINGFNREDVYIKCSCPDASYRMNFWQTKNNIIAGEGENRPSDITNPDDNLGSGCKHVLLVLSNTSWILKVAATIYNYVNYMEKHYSKLYADIIYPVLYNKKYEEPVQLDISDSDNLDTDTNTIDKSNQYAVDKTRFKSGNTSGVRFASKSNDPDQISLFDENEEIDDIID